MTMTQNQDVQAVLAKLPPVAFIDNSAEHRLWPSVCEPVVLLRRGTPGFFPLFTRLSAAELNRRSGVTEAQAAAMLVGCCYGWEDAGADPDFYDERGHARHAH